jgi:hypothetical protein
MRNARVTVLMRPDEKAALEARAAQRGLSSGEYIRLAVDNLPDEPTEEEELAALVDELVKAVPEMRASLERTTKLAEKTVREVDAMLRKAGVRK